MQRLNAIDAIAPAFTRTHELLFHPFRVGRSWKLAASCYLAFCGSVFIPFPLFFRFLPGMRQTPHAASLFLWSIGIVYSLIVFALFYFGARMSFVNFEMVVSRQVLLGPMWKHYGSRVWPWIGLKAVTGTVLCTALAPLIVRAGRNLFSVLAVMPPTAPGQRADPALIMAMFHRMFGFYLILFAAFFVLKSASTLLDDFVQPFFLLENISLLTALRRGLDVFLADPLQLVLYLFLKLVLSILGYVLQSIASQVLIIPIVLLGAILAGIGTVVLHPLGPAGTLIGIAGAILLGILFVSCLLYATLGVFGYFLLLLQTYAMYFLAGRYPLLGNLLDPNPYPGPAAPFTPPPPPPAPDEDDNGPPLPMDPALA